LFSEDASRHLRVFLSFPSLRIILFINIILESLISLEMFALFPFIRVFPQTLVLFFTPSLFSALVHRTFFHGDRVFTLRRFYALQLVQEAIYVLLLIVGALAAFLLQIEPGYVIPSLILFGVAASSYISFLVVTGFYRGSPLVILAASLLNIFLQSLRWIVMSIILFENLIEALSVMLLSFSTGLLLLVLLSLKKVRGKTPPLKVFKAYLDYHLDRNEEPLESFFEETSQETNLKLSSATFTAMGKPFLSLIGLNIHFGPFGTVGSSPLPSRLVEELEEKSGRRILLLRSLSDHSLNLPSKREVEKIGSLIMAGFNSSSMLKEALAGFSQKEADGYCVTAVRLGHYCIAFLSCPGYSAEDLPWEWLPRLSSVVEKHGLTPLLICDAHNSIDLSNRTVHNPDENRFAGLLEETVTDLEKAVSEGLEVGFNRIRPKGLPGDEIGRGGVSALVFNIGGKKHAIITIDGNNMAMGVRNRLIKGLKETMNISTLEIVTTDTHILTGLKKAEKGYFPVGFKTPMESLLEACRECLAGALEKLSPCGLEAYMDDAKLIRVTGDIFTELEKLIEYSEKAIVMLLALLELSTGLLIYVL
jgi:putative membrane protein